MREGMLALETGLLVRSFINTGNRGGKRDLERIVGKTKSLYFETFSREAQWIAEYVGLCFKRERELNWK